MIAELTVCGLTVTVEEIALLTWTYTAHDKTHFYTGTIHAYTEDEAIRTVLAEVVRQ